VETRINIAMQIEDSDLLVVVTGELDYVSGWDLRAAVDEADLEPVATVRLDLAGVTFIDSVGVNHLVHVYHRAKGAGLELTVSPVSHIVGRVLAISGLTKHLRVGGVVGSGW